MWPAIFGFWANAPAITTEWDIISVWHLREGDEYPLAAAPIVMALPCHG